MLKILETLLEKVLQGVLFYLLARKQAKDEAEKKRLEKEAADVVTRNKIETDTQKASEENKNSLFDWFRSKP